MKNKQGNMLIIHIEASHKRGMGHLFRSLNFINGLIKYAPQTEYLLLVNPDKRAEKILSSEGINFLLVSKGSDSCHNNDIESTEKRGLRGEITPENGRDISNIAEWEKWLVETYGVTCWLNDRLNTEAAEVERVTKLGIPVYTIDDNGDGACLCKANFASLVFESISKLGGQRVLTGERYLILNPEIDKFKRKKSGLKKIIVTMGGSDTYNLTLGVAGAVVNADLPVEVVIVIGPGSTCYEQVYKMVTEYKSNCNPEDKLHAVQAKNIVIKSDVPSLIEEIGQSDLAITAGGVTPFEAAALGTPTMCIASEIHEIGICRRLEELGCSMFLGYRDEVTQERIESGLENIFTKQELLSHMSDCGLKNVDTKGVERIVEEMGINDK